MNASTADIAEAEPQAQEAQGEQDESPPQALFFTDPHPLDKTRHAHAGLRNDAGYGFTAESNSIPVMIQELPEVVRSYPVVFSAEDAPVPVAILGLERRNAFLDKHDAWDAQHYVPGYVRKYPFALVRLPESERYALCVDEAAPHYMNADPDLPFYDVNGEATPMCQAALDFCGKYQQQYEATRTFGLSLKAAGLLAPRRIELNTPSGEKKSLGGFQLIDEEAWNRFAKTNIAEWDRKGYAALVCLALMSQTNWKYLARR